MREGTIECVNVRVLKIKRVNVCVRERERLTEIKQISELRLCVWDVELRSLGLSGSHLEMRG